MCIRDRSRGAAVSATGRNAGGEGGVGGAAGVQAPNVPIVAMKVIAEIYLLGSFTCRLAEVFAVPVLFSHYSLLNACS